MLHLLLDEQIDPAVATQMGRWRPEILLGSLHAWEDGRYLRAGDATILTEAHRQGLTLVTYDTRTIVPLLKVWGESGTSYGGVIFIKSTAIAQGNIGAIVWALARLWERYGEDDWTNATIYLTP
jgi:hypothetical protein